MADKEGNPRAATGRCLLKNPLSFITILVGPEKKGFAIHKSLVTAKSEYFATALQKSFPEGESGIVEMSEADPKAFELAVAWFYTGEVLEVVEVTATDTDVEVSQHNTAPPAFETLVRLWLLADYLLLPELQNEVIITLCKRGLAGCQADKKMFSEVCSEIPAGSPLQRCIVDMCVWNGFQYAESMYRVNGQSDLPHEMLGEIAVAYKKKDKLAVETLKRMKDRRPNRKSSLWDSDSVDTLPYIDYNPSPLQNPGNYFVEVRSDAEK